MISRLRVRSFSRISNVSRKNCCANFVRNQSTKSGSDVSTRQTSSVSSLSSAAVINDKFSLTPYLELSKYRLSGLVVFTTSAGYLAAGGPIQFIPFASACAGTMLAACSANTFNQIIERNRDALMKRTLARPLPSGRLTTQQAAVWGVGTAGASCAILLAGTNPLTAALGMGNLFLYAVPYTLSKTRTELNTWIGSVVGAIPPLMGWAAATGDIMAIEPVLLASTLFLWQFPHFFALSWMYRQDYGRGGFKMVPCADPTGNRTASLINRYSVYLTPVPIIAAASGATSWMFALEGTAINAALLYRAYKFNQDHSNANARDVFRASLWYLPLALSLFVFHSKRWDKNEITENNKNILAEELDVGPIEAGVMRIKKYLKSVCVHEVLITKTGDEHSTGGIHKASHGVGGALCPVVVAEKGSEKIQDAGAAVASGAVTIVQRADGSVTAPSS